MTPRCLHLRRPAVLQRVAEPFVPHSVALDVIDQRWQKMCEDNSNLFDGRLLHVINVHRNGCGGATLHVQDCAYRFHAVQDDSLDCGVRPLGVKGITTDDHGNVLLGQRSGSVAHYRNMWEFAPGGVVEPDSSPMKTVIAELEEETGLQPVHDPRPIAMIYDDVLRCWEMVFEVTVAAPTTAPHTTDEYTEIIWRTTSDLPRPLSPIAEQIARLIVKPSQQ